MPAEDFPTVIASIKRHRLESFRSAVAVLEAGRDAGGLANARFLEAKDDVSRAVEAAWACEISDKWAGRSGYEADTEERAAIYEVISTGHPAPHLMRSLSRRAMAVGETEAGRAIRAMLADLTPLMDLLAHCKTITIKRTPEALAQNRAIASPMRHVSKDTARHVGYVLDEVIAEARLTLVRSIEARCKHLLEQFLLAKAANDTPAEGVRRPVRFSPYEYSVKVARGNSSPLVCEILGVLLEETRDKIHGRTHWVPRTNHEALGLGIANLKADEMCRAYLERTLHKLCPIIESKGNLKRIEVLGKRISPAGMLAFLRVGFADDSRFDAHTTVVFSVSVRGVAFNRFPLTFHNVVMPDGTSLPNPSEERLNEIFAAPVPVVEIEDEMGRPSL